MLGISRHDHVTNESVYSQTQARPLSSEMKGRQLRFLGHSLRRDKEDHINRFALYVPSVGRRSVGGQKRLFLQYISRVIMGGSRALKEREIRHPTEDRDYWRYLVAASRDNADWTADETRRDETDRQGRHLRLTWPTTTEVSRSLGGLSWDWSAYHCEGSIGPSVRFEEFSLSRFKHYICHHYTEISGNLSFFNNNRNSSLLKCEKQNLRKSH